MTSSSPRSPLSVLGFLACLGLSLPATVAHADPATDVALEADAVNQEHCANLFSARVDTAATSTVRVAEVWQRVSEVYGETQAPYLLYWRGTLAQCLGREDAALADLNAFVEEQIGATMFASLVRNAQARLRRLGPGAGIGQGLAAAYMREGRPLEVAARYLGGSGVTILTCRDDGRFGQGQPINSGCVGGANPTSAVGAAVAPLGLDVGVDGFFTRSVGIGARVFFDVGAPVSLPDSRSPGARVEVQAGPQIRLLDSVASGKRAGWFRASLRFAAAFGQMSPWAGQAKYLTEMENFHDVGTWGLRHAGPALTIGGALEIGPGAILELEGRFTYFVATGAAGTQRVVDGAPTEVRLSGHTSPSPDDDTYRTEEIPAEFQPDATGSSRLHAGFRIGVLAPVGRGALAVGPFFDVALQETGLTFPDSPADQWCAAEPCSGDGDLRKVYSTTRDDILLRIGIAARFGAPPRDP